MLIKHKHHIVPRHMGGSNNDDNLIELTIEEHAEAHRILYEQYGKIEDKLAWMGLSGQIGKDEILLALSKKQKGIPKPKGHGEKVSAFRKSFKYSEQSKQKMSATKKGKILTDEHKQKIALAQTGKKQPDSQKEKVAKALAMDWQVTSPNGESFVVNNLRKFCIENNLDQGNLSRGKYKGWTAFKINK